MDHTVYGSETWMLRNENTGKLDPLEMYIWKMKEKIIWTNILERKMYWVGWYIDGQMINMNIRKLDNDSML